MKSIEVELRGKLDDANYERLIEYLSSNAELISRESRFLLDYSTFKEGIGERTLDVRARITNGKPEIVVKKGKFGGTSREEASVLLDHDSLERAVHLMALLGYRKAVACDRAISRYSCDGVEVSVQDILYFPKRGSGDLFGRFFEVEILCDEPEKERSVSILRSWVKDRGLTTFSEEDWNSFVEKMNQEANGVYDFDENSFDDIAECGLRVG